MFKCNRLMLTKAVFLMVMLAASAQVSANCGTNQCTYSIPIDKSGFYVVAVQLPADESEGMWGFSANTSGGRNVGGFNAGTVIEGNGALPGFMGFYLDAPEAVQIQLFDYSATPNPLKLTLSDNNSNLIQTHLFNSGESITTQSLATGFYVASVETDENSPRTRFGIAVTGSNLSGGVNVGGLIDLKTGGNGEGFGGLYVGTPQTLTFNLLYGDNYSSAGSGKPDLAISYQNPDGSRTTYWAAPHNKENFSYADGFIGQIYSQAVAFKPETGEMPFTYQITSGALPVGLNLDSVSGLIQGTPTTRGASNFTLEVKDSKGQTVELQANIKIYGILTAGKDGTFKGCNGLQMALNAVQNLDEIRIQQGTYDCVGLTLASDKSISDGIKISGGWDASFENQTINPDLTVFDAGNRVVAGKGSEQACTDVSGVWHSGLSHCYQKDLVIGRFFTLDNSAPIAIENFAFKNAYSSDSGGALAGQGNVTLDYMLFTDNTVYTSNHNELRGGAVYKVSHIRNSVFSGNRVFSASYYAFVDGGAVAMAGDISHSTFSGNSVFSYPSSYGNASAYGGAVATAGNISHSTFSDNRIFSYSSYGDASAYGGAVATAGNISHSIFSGNHISSTTASSHRSSSFAYGGAVYKATSLQYSQCSDNTATALEPKNRHASYGGALNEVITVVNSQFSGNAANYGGAVSGSKFITVGLFSKNNAVVGGAIYSIDDISLVSSTLVDNSASDSGGGFYGSGEIFNSIFYQNTAGTEANDIIVNSERIVIAIFTKVVIK